MATMVKARQKDITILNAKKDHDNTTAAANPRQRRGGGGAGRRSLARRARTAAAAQCGDMCGGKGPPTHTAPARAQRQSPAPHPERRFFLPPNGCFFFFLWDCVFLLAAAGKASRNAPQPLYGRTRHPPQETATTTNRPDNHSDQNYLMRSPTKPY